MQRNKEIMTKKRTVVMLVATLLLILIVGGAAYAYFAAQTGEGSAANIDVSFFMLLLLKL